MVYTTGGRGIIHGLSDRRAETPKKIGSPVAKVLHPGLFFMVYSYVISFI